MNYTTIEQSKRLIKLGLNPDTADMFYFLDPTPAGCIYHLTVPQIGFGVKTREPEYNKGDVPCWSLGALWDINNICGIGPNDFGNEDVSSEHLFNTLYNWICIELIEDSDGVNSFLIEEGYIKKGAKDE